VLDFLRLPWVEQANKNLRQPNLAFRLHEYPKMTENYTNQPPCEPRPNNRLIANDYFNRSRRWHSCDCPAVNAHLATLLEPACRASIDARRRPACRRRIPLPGAPRQVAYPRERLRFAHCQRTVRQPKGPIPEHNLPLPAARY
jgi:hypothetical protein